MIAAVAIPASLLLVEPKREKLRSRPSVREILSICHQSLFVNTGLSATILLSAVIGTSTLCMAWTCQVYFVDKGLNELVITPVWVILNLTVALLSAFSQKIRRHLGERLAIVLTILIIPAGYILLGSMPLIPGLACLLLFYGVRGYATPLLKDLTNQYCASDIRATVLSIRSLLVRTGFSILGPLIGFGSRRVSLSFALVSAGGVLLVFSLLAGLFLARHASEVMARLPAEDLEDCRN